MKNLKLSVVASIAVLFISLPFSGFGQSSVLTISSSNNSYQVHVRLTPTTVVVLSNCQYGYNYNVQIDYEISFTGNVPKDALNTLHGYLTCGPNAGNYFDLPEGADSGTTVTTGNPYRSQSDCQTATPQSLSCNTIALEINGKQIPNQTIQYTASPLPVEMTYFHAKNEGEQVALNWGTASEKDNDFFAVERSLDGVNWENIGRVEGNGTTYQGAEYSFTDFAPVAGTSYYRLMQNDFDGTFDYSDVVVVKRNAGINNVKVYPNPAQSVVTIEGNGVDVPVITNLAGQEVNSQVQMIESHNNSVSVDVSVLPTGMYFVHVGTEAYKLYVK